MMTYEVQNRKSILVVDDDPEVRETLQDVLEMQNYRVFTAEHGRSALELIRSQKIRPDLILLDLMMPVMTGWQFLEVLKADPEHGETPVVVFSAASEKARLLPASAVVPKPVEVETLLTIVEEHSR